MYYIITAESSAASTGSLLTNAAKYFMCKEQATIAENLSAYIAATTPPINILLGMYSEIPYIMICRNYIILIVVIYKVLIKNWSLNVGHLACCDVKCLT